MTELSKPFPAYQGDEPFVFVCYAHSDAETVCADLRELSERGLRLWYDEGIGAGTVPQIRCAVHGSGRRPHRLDTARYGAEDDCCQQ